MKLGWSLGKAAGLVVTLSGCFSQYSYKSDFSQGFPRAGHRVSVFGVFKDGRMDFESWDALSRPLSAALGGGKCAAGYSADFVSAHGALAGAIDDVARANGLEDDLLAQIGVAAQGDVIVVFTVAGRVEKSHIDVRNEPARGMGGGMAGGGGGGGAPGALGSRLPMAPNGKKPPASTAALDLSATLFSPSKRESVGVIELEYTGENADEAVAQFAAKVREAIPGSSCEGWNWSAPIDEHRVRDLVE